MPKDNTVTIQLQYYDINGHNWGVQSEVPDRKQVKKVTVLLPGQAYPDSLKAVATYRKAKRVTLRSKTIDKWLRKNSHVGQCFAAKLTISEDGSEHSYSDITPIWITI